MTLAIPTPAAEATTTYLTPRHVLDKVEIHVDGKPGNYFVEWDKNSSFKAVRDAFKMLGLAEVCVVRPGFNGLCLRKPQLRFEAVTPYARDPRIFTSDKRADSIIIEPGEAAAWASADCPTVVIVNSATREVAVIHGARSALLPARLRLDQKGAEADVITTTIQEAGWNPGDLSVLSVLGIGPDHFLHPLDHPEYGQENREMLAYIRENFGQACTPGPENEGRIDPFRWIQRICRKLGVRKGAVKHDRLDTYSDTNRWHSYRRSRDLGQDTRDRNLVTVVNRIM